MTDIISRESVEVGSFGDVQRLAAKAVSDGASQVLFFGPTPEAATVDNEMFFLSKALKKQEEPDTQQLDPKSREVGPFGTRADVLCPDKDSDPEIWVNAPDFSTRLRKSIALFALNAFGRGYQLERLKKYKDASALSEKVLAEIDAEFERLSEFFDRPNEEASTAEIFQHAGIDYLTTGNAYVEVVCNARDEVVGMWHAQSRYMRLRTENKGYVQVVDSRKRHFRRMSEERTMDSETGLFEDDPEFPRPLPIDRRANRMMHFRVYSAKSPHYGVAPYIASSPAITGDRAAALRNVYFFKNDASPRCLIVISGGTITQEAINSLTEMFGNAHKGVENSHRMAVVQAQPHDSPLTGATATKIEVIPLTIGKTDDASFGDYRSANGEELREAIGISKVFFTTDDVNRASSQESRRITEDQEFEPARSKWEHAINNQLMPRLHAKYHVFKFARPVIADQALLGEVVAGLSEQGVITPNEGRDMMGMQRYPDLPEYHWANIPFPMTLALLKMGGDPFSGKLEGPPRTGVPGSTGGSPERESEPVSGVPSAGRGRRKRSAANTEPPEADLGPLDVDD